MANQSLISVVIPCYNQGRFLKEAIESVLAQTYSRFEVIVVDDGSTDDTAEVAARFDGTRCLHQCNLGLAAARNAGLHASTGDFVVFLDADDRLLPDAIQDQLNCLENHFECAFVYGHVRLIAIDGSPLPAPHQAPVEGDHYLELLRRNYIWTSGAVLYRRRALESVGGFNASAGGSADFELNARIARLFPICCSDGPVLEYRRHDESMSRDCARMLRASVGVRREHRRLVRGRGLYEEALRAGIRRAQADYGEKLIEIAHSRVSKADWRGAMNALFILLRYYPMGFLKRARRRLNNLALHVQG
jgi:glycosyltransferase involved in cell wall biosynthesis